MQGYNGPAALNEGIRAMGDVFSPETAMNRQKAIMYKQQFEQTMKPLTLDEIASKTAPDLWGPMQKLAEANGIVEENNGVKFIRQGNLRQFHDDLGKNKVWQAQLLDESSKLNKGKLDEITPKFEQAKKQWEASIAIYKYKAEQEMAKAKEEGRPPDVPALMKLEEQIKEAQNKYPVYKQMMTLGQQREAIMGSYKKRITSMGLLDEGFKKDVEKYGEPDAIKIALNPEYRRQLDMQRMKDEARIKADEIRYTEQVKAGLKEDKPVADIQEYEYARKQGYKGSYVDWQRVKQKPTDNSDKQQKAFDKETDKAVRRIDEHIRANYDTPLASLEKQLEKEEGFKDPDKNKIAGLEKKIADIQGKKSQAINTKNGLLNGDFKANEIKWGGGVTQPAQPSKYPNAPKVGTVQDGYRYKGGNPADQNSWELAKK